MSLYRRAPRGEDSGFTLVEMLVASMIMLVVMGLSLTTISTFARSSDRIRTDHDLNEEARNALNRMSRELREASRLTSAINPSGTAGALTAVTFEADFNGDGCAGNACFGTDTGTNPETLTYCFDPNAAGEKRTYLWLIPEALATTATSCEVSLALPILAGHVQGFSVGYRSKLYRYDTGTIRDDGTVVDAATPDGITTWVEIDAAPPPVGDVGGSDGDINTTAATSIDSLVLRISMEGGDRHQDYMTQVDLRNRA